MRKQLFALILFVFALRLPFLNQAIQGDDLYYLYGAQHAQIDPLHPNHAQYAFLGQMVDMRGHPHPPLDAWMLGALLAVFGHTSEIPFHAAFVVFSLLAAVSAFFIARRFSPYPMAATMLFLVTPAFVVNGNSLETDVPFTAFWLAAMASFFQGVAGRSSRWLAVSIVPMVLAAFTAYQAVFAVPILLLYSRRWKPGWVVALTIPAVIGLWQLYEKANTGTLPATVLSGYMETYGLQEFTQKTRNAVALTGHLGWVVFPILPFLAFGRRRWWQVLAVSIVAVAAAFYDPNPLFWGSIGIGILMLAASVAGWREFLNQWILLFFGAALIVFFAGSARYLLPMVLPIAILVSMRLSPRRLWTGVAAGACLSLSLAVVNYQHWDGYRQFAQSLTREVASKRVWINGEWGLRYYLEREGALPLLIGETIRPDDRIMTSTLGYPRSINTGGTLLVTESERTITSPIPLRLVSLHGRSAYSTTLFGLRPFDLSTDPIDVVRAEVAMEKRPELSMLPMNSPRAEQQIVNGIYGLENGKTRWMAGKAVVLLKPPAGPARLKIEFYVPPQAPVREVTATLGNATILRMPVPGSGSYKGQSEPQPPPRGSTTVVIQVDKTFSVPGDHRELGILLISVGWDSP